MENAICSTSSAPVPCHDAHDRNRPDGFRERLLARALRRIASGRLAVSLPSGAQVAFGDVAPGPEAVLQVHHPHLVTRLLAAGDIGFAEGYMAGDWDSPDLTALFELALANEPALAGVGDQPLAFRILSRALHALRANTPRGSRRNIAAHYDLGNDFYGKWLDETMSYSSALFVSPDEPMVLAQRRKYLRLAEALDLRPGDRLLEIGCGWGGFAEIAARDFGCHVTALTLSKEQAAYATNRMAALGLGNLVDIRIQDYRHVSGKFDKIASIEMFEAVGESYWPTYLETLKSRLVAGGRAGLQIIMIHDDQFERYRRSPDFIQRYVFPGGMLPAPRAFRDAVARAGLRIVDEFAFGPSYAETLRRWDSAFLRNWPEIERLGFDERFRRMWHYYLKYCEVGFDSGRTDVCQFLVEAA